MRRRTTLAWPSVVVAAFALTACGSVADGSPGQAPPSIDGSPALAAWKDFPAAANPRPVVLLGQPVIDPRSGFRNDADKMAYDDGNLVLGTSLPEMTAPPDGGRLVSASSALQVLVGPRHNVTLGAPTLTVTGARLARATFATDRGEQSLPVWVFTLRGVADPASVLALPAADYWPKAGTAINQVVAVPAGSQDSRQVTVRFIGGASGTGPCTTAYSASVAESATAVMVTPVAQVNPASKRVLCTLEGHRRSLTVTLPAPLGGRVLLTPDAG